MMIDGMCLWCDRTDGTHSPACERATKAEARLQEIAPLTTLRVEWEPDDKGAPPEVIDVPQEVYDAGIVDGGDSVSDWLSDKYGYLVRDWTAHDPLAATWLAELFEHEYCAECGGDAEHHTAVPLLGNWFARCDYPPDDDGNYHPVIASFREVPA